MAVRPLPGAVIREHRARTSRQASVKMGLNIRIDGDIVILSNFGRLMNDPRYVDAARDVGEMLDQGVQNFIIELAGVKEAGSSLLGVLMTITREIRHRQGEAVLAHLSREMEKYIGMMQMDDYWDVFSTVDEAKEFFHRKNHPHVEPIPD